MKTQLEFPATRRRFFHLFFALGEPCLPHWPNNGYLLIVLVQVAGLFLPTRGTSQPSLFQKKIENAPYFHVFPDAPASACLLTSLTGIARADTNLNILWQRSFGSFTSGTQFFPLATRPQPGGNGYLVTGYGRQVAQAKFAVALTETDAGGAPQSSKLYMPSGLPLGAETTMQLAIPTADGGFLCAGLIYNSGLNGPEWYLLKLSAAGAIQWARGYRSNGDERLSDVRQLPDGSYIAAFTIDDEMALAKVDANGQPQWGMRYGTGKLLNASVAYDPVAGGYAVAGGPATGNTSLLFHTDAVGGVVWSQAFSTVGANTVGRFHSIQALSDGFLLGGTFGNSTAGTLVNPRSFLLKTTLSGTIAWVNLYEAAGDNRFVAATPFAGAGIVLSCAVPGNPQQGLLARLDPQGVVPGCPGATLFFQQTTGSVGAATSIPANPLTSAPLPFTFVSTFNLPAQNMGAPAETVYCFTVDANEPLTPVESGLHVFPNPAADRITVRIETSTASEGRLHLVDLSGKTLFCRHISSGDCMLPVELDLGALPPGGYILRVVSMGRSNVVKLVKQ